MGIVRAGTSAWWPHGEDIGAGGDTTAHLIRPQPAPVRRKPDPIRAAHGRRRRQAIALDEVVDEVRDCKN